MNTNKPCAYLMGCILRKYFISSISFIIRNILGYTYGIEYYTQFDCLIICGQFDILDEQGLVDIIHCVLGYIYIYIYMTKCIPWNHISYPNKNVHPSEEVYTL